MNLRSAAATGLATAVLSAVLVGPAAASSPVAPESLGPNKVECRALGSAAEPTSATCAAKLVGGRAVPPPGAPTAVREVIEAANRIRHTPYVWGGGHLGWDSRGYDCSGAVGYALHGAGMLDRTAVSGELERWGAAGTGRWVTVYANRRHAYMVVAGLRFDTRDGPTLWTGARWHTDMPREPTRYFAARHPSGL